MNSSSHHPIFKSLHSNPSCRLVLFWSCIPPIHSPQSSQCDLSKTHGYSPYLKFHTSPNYFEDKIPKSLLCLAVPSHAPARLPLHTQSLYTFTSGMLNDCRFLLHHNLSLTSGPLSTLFHIPAMFPTFILFVCLIATHPQLSHPSPN